MSFSEATYGPLASQILCVPDTMRALVLDGVGIERLRICAHTTGSSGGSPWDIALMLELMAACKIDAGKHISRAGDFYPTIEFLAMVKGQHTHGKAVVYPHQCSDEVRTISSLSSQDEHAYLHTGGSGPWH